MKTLVLFVLFLSFLSPGCGEKKDETKPATTTPPAKGTVSSPPAGEQATTSSPTSPGSRAQTSQKKPYTEAHNPCIKKNLKPDPQSPHPIKIEGQLYDIKKIDDLIQKGVCV